MYSGCCHLPSLFLCRLGLLKGDHLTAKTGDDGLAVWCINLYGLSTRRVAWSEKNKHARYDFLVPVYYF